MSETKKWTNPQRIIEFNHCPSLQKHKEEIMSEKARLALDPWITVSPPMTRDAAASKLFVLL